MNAKTHKYLRRKHATNVVARKSKKPRLIVARSNKHIHAQIVDVQGVVLMSAYDHGLTGTKQEKAKAIGLELGKKAVDQGLTQVVFDRNGYLYHGRVANVAQGAREAGLVL